MLGCICSTVTVSAILSNTKICQLACGILRMLDALSTSGAPFRNSKIQCRREAARSDYLLVFQCGVVLVEQFTHCKLVLLQSCYSGLRCEDHLKSAARSSQTPFRQMGSLSFGAGIALSSSLCKEPPTHASSCSRAIL